MCTSITVRAGRKVPACGNGELAAVGHRVAGIDGKVHDYLFDLIAVCANISDTRIKTYRDTNVFADQTPRHPLHSGDNRIQIDHYRLLNLLAAKREQLLCKR